MGALSMVGGCIEARELDVIVWILGCILECYCY